MYKLLLYKTSIHIENYLDTEAGNVVHLTDQMARSVACVLHSFIFHGPIAYFVKFVLAMPTKLSDCPERGTRQVLMHFG